MCPILISNMIVIMKTCPKCGNTTDNDQAKFCKKCGASYPEYMSQKVESPVSGSTVEQPSEGVNVVKNDISPISPTLGMEDVSSSHLPEQEEVITPEYLKRNSEIGGWLAFFLFSICLGGTISAIMSLVQMNSLDYQDSTLLALTDVALGFMLCALSFYTLYSFIQRKPDAVYLGKLYVVTTFLSNLLVLFNGDFEATGLGSLPQIVRGLIWGVIWYAFLCLSSRVEEVIPKEYRKNTTKDYCITIALYLIPIVFFIAGVASLQTVHQKQQEEFVKTAQLGVDEYTDGKMIFKLPEGFTSEREELQDPKLTVFHLENENIGSVTMCSDYDTDMSQKNFNQYCKGWEDETAKQYTASVVCNEKRSINGRTYWYKVTSYETNGTVYWRFILLFDNASGKVAVISAYDGGYDSYVEELLNSIRFK